MKKAASKKPKNADWVEIAPYGVSFQSMAEEGGPLRPIMLLRDKAAKQTLAVWLTPMDANIMLSQRHVESPMLSPHQLPWEILEKLGVKLTRCCFIARRGHHQWVRLYFEGSDLLKTLETRADLAMSFCLQAQTKFYCQPEFFEECRELPASMMKMAPPSRKFGRRPGTFLN